MTQEEYKQKRCECWEEFLQKHGISTVDGVTADAFIMAFDRAYALGKQEKDEDIVMQGWVARDDDGELYIYSKKPNRTQWLRWAEGSNFLPLLPDLFPDLTWEDDPQEVEITIKRKKNG